MTSPQSPDDMDLWLAKPLDEVVQHLTQVRGRSPIIKYTCAPRRGQGPGGTWRVVKVWDDGEGITLTAAWQPPANALGFDAELS